MLPTVKAGGSVEAVASPAAEAGSHQATEAQAAAHEDAAEAALEDVPEIAARAEADAVGEAVEAVEEAPQTAVARIAAAARPVTLDTLIADADARRGGARSRERVVGAPPTTPRWPTPRPRPAPASSCASRWPSWTASRS